MLLTKSTEAKLRANELASTKAGAAFQERPDHKPVVKFFLAGGAATWLMSELDENGDLLYGIADMGMGSPEFGYTSLRELQGVKASFARTAPGVFSGHAEVERDTGFEPRAPMSVYFKVARQERSLEVAIERIELGLAGKSADEVEGPEL